ncbi:ABC transporter substrate-binding protein [Pseudonocardia phyllosphaerae]|uniref:ABC transporter substrate-binding protein n=1 Tax=Pseudonocardia phyllosphaerae TaxID=3390502 RepID=UPI003979DE7B
MTTARSRRVRSLTGVAAVSLTALVLAGCGAGGDGSGGSAPSGGSGAVSTDTPIPAAAKDEKLAAMVPAAVKADGKWVVGTDPTYPPNEFTGADGSSIIGMDVDLGTAVAQKLGLQPQFQQSQFSGIIPGITGGRYEAGISSLTINAERTKVLDMVGYFSAGTSFATRKGNPDKIDPNDLCGKAVGVQQGTVQVEDVQARTKKCTDAGKPAIAVTELQAQTDVTLALNSNRIVAMLADSPVASYAQTTTQGAVEVSGQPYDTAPYGIAVKKNDGQYAKAVQGAVQALIADGTYAKILDKWNVANGAVPTSQINGG